MQSPAKTLSLFDSTCILVGVIIGAGIYETTPMVAAGVGSGAGVLVVWLLGGLLALCGVLCYAELATTYPHQGGDYVYLSRAYGSWAGYFFGWSQLAIIRPGDIALMAFVFARYATTLYAPFPGIGTVYAASTVIILTAVNMLGVRESKWAQNAMTVLKVAGLLFIVVVGLLAPGAGVAPPGRPFFGEGLKLAMILVLFSYGGWNEMAYVAAEIKAPQKNILRSMVLGMAVVTLLYLLTNCVFLHALGYQGLVEADAVAVDAVACVWPDLAARLIGVIICVSALGAVNGLIFTGARISYALGAEHPGFRGLGKWHPRYGTPVVALAVQGALGLGIVLVAGSFIDTILYSAPAVWLFFLATAWSVFRLRKKDASRPRPYRVLGYPVVPILFCAASAFMLYSSLTYAVVQKPIGVLALLAVFAVGAAVYRLR